MRLLSIEGIEISDNRTLLGKILHEIIRNDYSYKCIEFKDIRSIFKRRHQLKKSALELTDKFGASFLFSCKTEREMEDVLRIFMESPMPSNFLHRSEGLANLPLGIKSSYETITARYLNVATKLWIRGEMTNFDYLMTLNIASGRSFEDLTSYPVFPWVLSNYETEELDLSNPAVFRDLSKPMGALGEKRAAQFRDRFESLNEFRAADSAPPFFYGTHYSCTGYVLHYLLRLQPFTNMAISHQGGQFDKPDRLFRSIEASWKSASQENIQDVRELVPEFYCLPEFLVNRSNIAFGQTQRGEIVDDVVLPPWAKGDPVKFIEMHRSALESRYVSENLHLWIDLIFGYRQRGAEAEKAANLFVHVTYDGEVDIDAIDDPVLKASTISQINNFGQTPSQIFTKPHPKRVVPEIATAGATGITLDSSGLNWHDNTTPPFTTVGAGSFYNLQKVLYAQQSFRSDNRPLPVSDIWSVSRDRVQAVPLGAILLRPKCVQYITYGPHSTGFSIRNIQSTFALEGERISIHGCLHAAPITAIAAADDGMMIITGSEDMSIRIWSLFQHAETQKLEHLCTLTSHTDTILCLDFCMELSLVASGSNDNTCMIWDAVQGKRIRVLGTFEYPVISVSINRISGQIAVVTAYELRLYYVNGGLIDRVILNDFTVANATCVLAPPCGCWQNAVLAVTGHVDGNVNLWSLRTDRRLSICHTILKTHRVEISALKICSQSGYRNKTLVLQTYEPSNCQDLLIGDIAGFVSRWSPYKLDLAPSADVAQIFEKYATKEDWMLLRKSS